MSNWSSSPQPATGGFGFTPDPLITRPGFIRRVARVGLAANLGLFILMLNQGAATSHLLGVGAIIAFLIAIEVRRRVHGPSSAPLGWPVTAAAILGAMTAVIVITGGARSVLLVLYVPAGFVMGLSTPPQARPLALVPPLLIGSMTVFALVWGPVHAPWHLEWQSSPLDASGSLNVLAPLVIALFSVTSFLLGREARSTIAESRREAEAAHAARVAALDERHAALLGLVGAVAHELKNPLTTVQSLSSHLHRKADPSSSMHTALGVMRGDVDRMRRTVDMLLNTARPISEHVVAPGDLHAIAAEVERTYSALAEEREVDVRLLPGTARIAFDRRKLEQVVGNLLLNAIEACPPGSRVELAVGMADDGAWIEVRDDGPGIPAHVRAHIGRPGVTTKAGGSGIGLALSSSIVEQHRGRLVHLDGPDGGCRARVWLPRTSPRSETRS